MSLPVILEDEEQFLCTSQRENWHEDFAAAVENAGNGFEEGGFSLGAWRGIRDAEGGLGDHHVDFADVLRHLGRDQVAVWLAGVVAREEDVEAGDVDEEHGGAEDVASRVGCDTDGGDGVGGVEVDCFDLGKSGDVVLLCVEGGALVGG